MTNEEISAGLVFLRASNIADLKKALSSLLSVKATIDAQLVDSESKIKKIIYKKNLFDKHVVNEFMSAASVADYTESSQKIVEIIAEFNKFADYVANATGTKYNLFDIPSQNIYTIEDEEMRSELAAMYVNLVSLSSTNKEFANILIDQRDIKTSSGDASAILHKMLLLMTTTIRALLDLSKSCLKIKNDVSNAIYILNKISNSAGTVTLLDFFSMTPEERGVFVNE